MTASIPLAAPAWLFEQNIPLAILIVVMNLVSDILYTVVDPRIKLD